MKTYKNRYGDIFTFTEDDDNNILWEGEFKYCRFGMPNDYTKAYQAYLDDREGANEDSILSLEEFKTDVHAYQGSDYLYPEYVKMVESITNKISMIDPSGGPYISVGMPLDSFGFKKYVVKDFELIDTGYKIVTEKCSGCNKPGAIHKMSCPTQKATVFITDEVKAYYDQMEKDVHHNRSNLNE
jgi:hypothetical protein